MDIGYHVPPAAVNSPVPLKVYGSILDIERYPSMEGLLAMWHAPDFQAAKKLTTGLVDVNFTVAIEGGEGDVLRDSCPTRCDEGRQADAWKIDRVIEGVAALAFHSGFRDGAMLKWSWRPWSRPSTAYYGWSKWLD